jgi:Fe-S cluster biogenesis protein NfuA
MMQERGNTMTIETAAPELSLEQVETALNRIRPYARSHGGDIFLVAIEGANVRVRMKGACVGCPSSTVTLKQGVERALREEVAGFGELIAE